MALPEQIRKQSEAVQEIYKQLDSGESTGTPSVADDTAASTEQAAPEADSATNFATPVSADEQQQGTDNVPEDDPNSETYAQKWRTLQGMYNAEVPRLHHQNREMTQRLQQLEQLLASMSAVQPAAPAQQNYTADRLVTDKDVEEYGESLDVMRRVSREEVGSMAQRLAALESMIQQMQSQVVPQVQNLTHRQQVSAEQQFWADLSSAVPNFRQVNDRQDFQTWLLSPDPLTGITRQTYLDDAQRSLDARRVANIFHTWLESTGQASVAQSPRNTAASELEKQVTPGRSRGAGSPANASQAKMYSPTDIQKFFNDVRTGKYKGREQERSRIERDIFAAQREGRIVANA